MPINGHSQSTETESVLDEWRWTDIDGWMDRWTDEQTRWMDGQILIDKWKWMDGWVDG